MLQPDQLYYSDRDYLAPTVYLDASRYISNWNYYTSLENAKKKWAYLNNQGGSNITPAGIVSFVNNHTAQTLGINVDFYLLVSGEWQLASYKYVRSKWPGIPPAIIRFYTKEGNGPYYTTLNQNYFGVSATTITSIAADKLQALDDYFREVQLMKYRYNAFVGFLNDLSKYQSNSITLRVYNEGLNLMKTFKQQMDTVKQIEIEYAQGERIGALPVLAVIAIIALFAGAAGWTVATIVSEKEKTKRINDAYELNKWVAGKKIEVGAMVTAGTLSSDQAKDINGQLDAAAAAARKVADQASKSKTIFGDLSEIVKWGVGGLIGYTLLKQFGKNKSGA